MDVDPHRTVRATRNRIEGGLSGLDTALPGEMWPRTVLMDGHVVPVGYQLYCPGCARELWIPTGPDDWQETGDLDAGTLTLTPSLANRCCGWHGHLIDGVFTPV